MFTTKEKTPHLSWGFCLVSVFLVVMSGCGTGSPEYYHAKYSPSGINPRPSVNPEELVIQKQVEGHTCGYHSLSSIYYAHGLDPAVLNLRFRLGVDKAAVPFDSETLGSLHPDIFRVARQDGFHLSVLDPESINTKALLCEHGAEGLYSMVLISRKQNGNLHWVVLGKCDSDKVMVYDSLSDSVYQENPGDYLKENVLSIITFNPNGEVTTSVPGSHLDGIKEMNKVRKRINSKKNRTETRNP